MIKFGQITAYDPQTGYATIQYIRPDACAKCGACGSLNQVGSIRLKCSAKEGSWVRISFPDRHFLSSAAIAYVIPLFCFLAGLFAGYIFSGKSELWGLIGGLGGLLISLLGLYIAEKVISRKKDWVPVVDRVYESKPADMDELGCGM